MRKGVTVTIFAIFVVVNLIIITNNFGYLKNSETEKQMSIKDENNINLGEPNPIPKIKKIQTNEVSLTEYTIINLPNSLNLNLPLVYATFRGGGNISTEISTRLFWVDYNPIGLRNDSPTAYDDFYSVDEDSILIRNLSRNTYKRHRPRRRHTNSNTTNRPTHGILTLNTMDHSHTHPTTNYNGHDTFTYQAYDGTNYSNTATVTITINPINDAPIANNDYYNTNEGHNIKHIITRNTNKRHRPRGDPLTAIKTNDPTHGILTLNTNGSFTYTPNNKLQRNRQHSHTKPMTAQTTQT